MNIIKLHHPFFRSSADVITVSDSEMFAAMRLLAERMKLVVEASAGAALAGALKLHQHEVKDVPYFYSRSWQC